MEQLKRKDLASLTIYQSSICSYLICLSFRLNSNQYNGQLNIFLHFLCAFYVFSYLMLLGKFQFGNKMLQNVKILASDALEAVVILFYHSDLKKIAVLSSWKGLKTSHHSLAVSLYHFQCTFINVGFPDVYLWWLWWQGGAACVFLCKNFSCNMILTQTLFGRAWFSQHSDSKMPQMHFGYVLKVISEDDEEFAPGIPHQPDTDISLILKPMICSQIFLAAIHFKSVLTLWISMLSLSNKDKMTSSSRFTFWELDEERACTWGTSLKCWCKSLSGCGNIHTS